MIQELISRNHKDIAIKVYNSPYYSFKDYDCDPKLLNQLAFILYELNEIEESERIINKGLKLAEAQNSNQEILIILQMNFCLLRYIQGDYSRCKNIIQNLNFDLCKNYRIINGILYEDVVKNICFFKGFFGDTQYLSDIKILSKQYFPNENNLGLMVSLKYDLFISYLKNKNFQKASVILEDLNSYNTNDKSK